MKFTLQTSHGGIDSVRTWFVWRERDRQTEWLEYYHRCRHRHRRRLRNFPLHFYLLFYSLLLLVLDSVFLSLVLTPLHGESHSFTSAAVPSQSPTHFFTFLCTLCNVFMFANLYAILRGDNVFRLWGKIRGLKLMECLI